MTTIEQTTFAALCREYQGLETPRQIAEAMWSGHGVTLFELMPEEWVLSLLSERVRTHMNQRRSSSIHVEYDTHQDEEGTHRTGICRTAVAGDYWSVTWLVHGKFVETRDLTVSDIAWLVLQCKDDMTQLRGKVLFLQAAQDLAKKHHAKTLGDLKRKGVELPSVEFRMVNGE